MPTLLKCFQSAKAREGGSLQGDATQQTRVTVQANETWRVVYDGIVDWTVVLTASLGTAASTLPQRGDVKNGLICTRANPIRSNDSPFVWDVTVEYNSIQQPTGTGNTNNWNINLRRGSVAREETIIKDRLGLGLVNAIGDLLPQLPSLPIYDELITVTWSTSKAPKWANDNYEGWVNNDPVSFTICGITKSYAKGQMKCTGQPLNCTRTQTGADASKNPTYTIHYDCEMSFHIRKPKWVWYAPNEGFRGFADAQDAGIGDGDLIDTFRDHGVPRSQATKLALDGSPLAKGSDIIRLPDGAYGKDVPNGCRKYDQDGAFELEGQRAMASLFTGLNDGEQHP